jgi:hypothetical protein
MGTGMGNKICFQLQLVRNTFGICNPFPLLLTSPVGKGLCNRDCWRQAKERLGAEERLRAEDRWRARSTGSSLCHRQGRNGELQKRPSGRQEGGGRRRGFLDILGADVLQVSSFVWCLTGRKNSQGTTTKLA